MRYPLRNSNWICMFILAGFVFLCLQLLGACGKDVTNNSSRSDSQMSSVDFSIRWHDVATAGDSDDVILMANLNCEANGIEQIACDVYDETGQWLVTAGPWSCASGTAVVQGIPAGSDRTFVISAQDSDDLMFYHGETSGILIEAGVITQGVMVDAYPFEPILTTPDEGVEVDPAGTTFAWDELQNAGQYLIQISEDSNFENPLIDEVTAVNSYTAADLSAETEYFWRVQAYDRFTNPGVWSETGSFSTTTTTTDDDTTTTTDDDTTTTTDDDTTTTTDDDTNTTDDSLLESSLGIWEGEGLQFGTYSWTIRITLAEDGHLIEYPSLNCGGTLTLLEESDDQLLFREHITYGTSYCVDNGLVELTSQDTDSLIYRWYYSYQYDQAAVGTVTRVED